MFENMTELLKYFVASFLCIYTFYGKDSTTIIGNFVGVKFRKYTRVFQSILFFIAFFILLAY